MQCRRDAEASAVEGGDWRVVINGRKKIQVNHWTVTNQITGSPKSGCPGIKWFFWGEIHQGLFLYSFIRTFQLKNSGKIQKQSLVNLSLAIYTEKIELWHIVIVLIPNHILRCWMHDHHCQGSADECQTSLQAGAASGAPGNLQHLHDFLTTTFHFGLARDASSISTFRSDQRLLDFQTFGRLWMTS